MRLGRLVLREVIDEEGGGAAGRSAHPHAVRRYWIGLPTEGAPFSGMVVASELESW
jgi:hypothetical protein